MEATGKVSVLIHLLMQEGRMEDTEQSLDYSIANPAKHMLPIPPLQGQRMVLG